MNPRLEAEMLGAHGRPDWLDLSDFLVHLAKGDDSEGYNTVIAILGGQRLVRGAKPFGSARRSALADSQRAICFSEVPLGYLGRLSQRRGTRYGVAFSKRFVTDRGGAPVWYLEHGTPQQAAFQELIDRTDAGDAEHPLWRLTPFVDFPSGPGTPYSYDFRWEREWRLTSDLSFETTEPAFLLIPEERHADARSFFADAVAENIGPGYFCPYIDPRWDIDRVKQALRTT